MPMRHLTKTIIASPAPKGELIGYARVSTADQVMDLQIVALKKAGCFHIHEEPATSGAKKIAKRYPTSAGQNSAIQTSAG